MPFKERSFPLGWRPLDDIERWPRRTMDGLRMVCEELNIHVDDKRRLYKDEVEFMNDLMKHYGLPYRDASLCALCNSQNEDLYDDYLSDAQKFRYNLVKARRYIGIPDRDEDPLNLTTVFYLKLPGSKPERLVRIGPKGCSCCCKFFSGERMHGYCRHILYVLRFILNCPKGLPFRDAFTLQEYDNIFAHSYPAQALKNAKYPNEDWRKVLDRITRDAEVITYTFKKDELLVCLNCFRPLYPGNCASPCLGCGNLVHSDCGGKKDLPRIKADFIYLEHPEPKSTNCAICRDREQWEVWTQSRGPPLPGDYKSCEEEMEQEPLESKLERIRYKKVGEQYTYHGSQE
ncbi:hypothetical protein QBC32DRAFT_365122 [Pseudoneurospora amorphoporcata]|uniref:SWIM-type domain-containing protein n=1 Tax=Pseudoneurospora amorphoporcata TaxID=241081 RepID=A0AAN6SCB5_9PEZI|nr:hypothetical protein QBC32DRAFT_365122 [Pseudoneurospora amorphoporcata]